jgi:hypothetical protein
MEGCMAGPLCAAIFFGEEQLLTALQQHQVWSVDYFAYSPIVKGPSDKER